MRLAKLELLAFGPFHGTVLDLGAPGIHVVFGRNEAGKSTSLRAIAGLLYGIDRNTTDAHVHRAADLRVGGVLEGAGGARLRVVRRKGNANTLLDERGQPLDEAAMRKLLGGVSRETFESAFGLDHVRLEAGAKALLDGRGDLGESLFDASVGGGGDVQRLLSDLERDADAIFRPRGTALPLNEAIKAFADAQKRVREKQSLPEAFLEQQKGLEQAVADRRTIAEEKAALEAKRRRLERARRRLPHERRRDRASERRAELGDIGTQLPRVEALRDRFAAYGGAHERQATHREHAARLADRVAVAAERAGIGAADGLRLDAQKEGRVHALLRDRNKLADRRASADVEIVRLERDVARLREAAPPAETSDDDHALAAALERARALGDVDARLAQERVRLARREEELEKRARANEESLDSVESLPLPSLEAVKRIDARAEELGRVEAQAGDRLAHLERDAAAIEKQTASCAGDFAPPDATALRQAREARDAAWRALCAAGEGTRREAEISLEGLLREADAIADRMIREADRVTTLARLQAEADANARQQEKARAESARLAAARDGLLAELAALFAEAGVRSRGFLEMGPWLERHHRIAEEHAALRAARAELAAEGERAERAGTELAAAIARIEGRAPGGTLADLVLVASRVLARIDAARREAIEGAKNLVSTREKLDERVSLRAQDDAALAGVAAKLGELLAPIGVAADASAEEVTRAIEALRELFALVDERASEDARARAAGVEVAAFEGDLACAVRDLAPELASRPPREAAVELFSRAASAREVAIDLAAAMAALEAEGEVTLDADERAAVADPDLAAQLDNELGERIDELDRDATRLTERVGALRRGLEEMRADSHAAQAAAEAQEALARVRLLAERFCRSKLAAVILAREIERYRDENQGPLLASASSLFARLTLGAFSGVKAGFDDKDRASLRCVRAAPSGASENEVDVAGLSDGTRDALYLSLRLASLLRRAEVSDPMPLVLDDILIHLDDERAAAALGVLAEVACRMQVLFFTHHARLVELARKVVPASDLVVHELAPASHEPAAAFA